MPALLSFDEAYINKDLIASLDAQEDAEPDIDESTMPTSPQLNLYYQQHHPYSNASFSSYPNTTRPRINAYRDYYPQDSYKYDHRHAYDYPKPSLDHYPPATLSHLHHARPQQPFAPPYSNAIQLSSQTPYGPHLPAGIPQQPNPSTNPSSSVVAPLQSNGAGAAGNGTAANGEEISTIFVVGFPEDMQEREFQNMFTFSPGFEAATLKIPNKEYTSYSGLMAPTASSTLPNGVNGIRPAGFQSYGSNDPYNLLTANQGGVVVDGGRDGLVSSWSTANPSLSQENDLANNATAAHYLSLGIAGAPPNLPPSLAVNNSLPPRKQIIGFAKFRTREEALGARDVLQGRRVDIEKGAVLKAEMAKKNLHTKRGVGPVSLGGFQSITQQSSQSSMDELKDPSVSNGLVAIGTRLGWQHQVSDSTSTTNGGPLNGSHIREEEDRKRDSGMNMVNLGMGGHALNGVPGRGPRERAEEEERERRRRSDEAVQKERELNLMRLRARDSAAFDAFHAVAPSPAPMSRQSSGGLASNSSNDSPSMGHAEATSDQGYVGPWDRINQPTQPMPIVRPRSASHSSSSSPPFSVHPPQQQHQQPFDGFQHYSTQTYRTPSESSLTSGLDNLGNGVDASGSIGPGLHQLTLNGNTGAMAEPNTTATPVSIRAAASELIMGTSIAGNGSGGGLGGQQTPNVSAQPGSGSGSTGNTSPTLPSPVASGGSASSSGSVGTMGERGPRGTIDQNPPINTLYVGNLPTSPPPLGYPHDYLEDTLRELFSQRPGYRKLCFRQKSNGPMCFVEFEDVHYAAKAMADMSGNTLRGVVKNGIRLSYSKNPLGVRTPTSAGATGGPTLQQQQQLVQTLNNHQHHHTQNQYHNMSHHPPGLQQQHHQPSDSFQTRMVEEFVPAAANGARPPPIILRRENNAPLSQTHAPPNNQQQTGNNFLSSPPPRFYSTSPNSNGLSYGQTSIPTTAPSSSSTLTGASSAFIPRGIVGLGSNGTSMGPSGFSPFGIDINHSYTNGAQPHNHLHQPPSSSGPGDGPV